MLAQLYRYAQPHAPRDRKVVVACVEGERHDFPARLVADALDLAGYETRFLGADVPTGSLLQVIEQESPDLLALSITMPFHAASLRGQMLSVRENTSGKLPIALGGLACAQLEPITLEIVAGSVQDLLGSVGRWLGA